MIKFTFIILFSILFSSCVNEVGDGSSTIIAPTDEESDENDGEPGIVVEGLEMPDDDDWNKGVTNDDEATLLIVGCTLRDSPNYNPVANKPCTIDCVGTKTGSNCCCQD